MNGLAILVAAGRGERMGAGATQGLPAAGRRAAAAARRAAPSRPRARSERSSPSCPRGELEDARAMLGGIAASCARSSPGGARRQDSVLEGMKQAPDGFAGVVLVHDAARPLRGPGADRRGGGGGARSTARRCRCCPSSTPSSACATAACVETVDRAELGAAQTPQGFRFELLARAYEAGLPRPRDADRRGDGRGAPGRAGGRACPAPRATASSRRREDLAWAEALLRARRARERASAWAAASTRTGWCRAGR